MQRCDFASVIAILRDGLIPGNYKNASALIEALFSDYQGVRKKCLDRSQVNKWIKGTLKLSDDIIVFYSNCPEHREALAEAVRDRLLKVMYDPDMTVQLIEELLMQDDTVSDTKKRQLCALRQNEDNAAFAAAVLIFSMQRRFIPAERKRTGKDALPTAATA